MDTALEKVANGKKASAKAVAEEAAALMQRAENAAKGKRNLKAMYQQAGRTLMLKGTTTTVLTLTSLTAGRFHESKVTRPAVRIGVGLVADIGGMGAQLAGVKNADFIHAVGDGVFYSGLAAASENYGREMAAKAKQGTPPAPVEEKPPAGVASPGRPRLPGARADDEDFVLTPKRGERRKREVVRLGRQ